MLLKRDNIKLGLLLGVLGPLLGLIIVYFLKFPSVNFILFVQEFFKSKALLTSIGSLSLLANVVLFTLYVNTQRDYTARGIFIVTLFYGIIILLLKLVL